MFERRSLKWPITLGVIMIVLIVALTVGWVVLAVVGLMEKGAAPLYWTLLTVGTTFLILVLVGVVMSMQLGIGEGDSMESMKAESYGLAIGGAMFVIGWLIERSIGSR